MEFTNAHMNTVLYMLIFFTLDKKRNKKGPLAFNHLHNDLKVDVENKKFCALFFDEKSGLKYGFVANQLRNQLDISIF